MIDFHVILWGFVLRVGQALIEASPTILCGFVVAAIFRRMVPVEATRKLFGSDSWTSLPRAWLIGTLLPVCSFGVIPVARELRRAGVKSGTVLTFALTAPLLNPLSILYGLTLSDPFVILCFVAASMIVAVIAGYAWNHYFEKTSDTLPAEPEPMPAWGLQRLAVVGVTASREMAGPTLLYIMIGLIGVGVVSTCIPAGALQPTMMHGDWTAQPLMAAVSLPAYAPPMKVMMMLGLMFGHGNSVGAAYVLLVVGAGMNVGLWAWMSGNFGFVRASLWVGVVAVIAVLFGYAAEYPLHFTSIVIDHTHAFDDFSSPFHAGSGTLAMERVWPKLQEKLAPYELVSLSVLGVMLLFGTILQVWDRSTNLERWFTGGKTKDLTNQPFWNRPLSPRFLGVVSLVGLAVLAVIGAYVYYPDPETVFDEMSRVRANALVSTKIAFTDKSNPKRQKKEAEIGMQSLRQMNDWVNKLQVGVYIRKGNLTEQQKTAAEQLQASLEVLFDALEHGEYAEDHNHDHHHHEDDHHHHEDHKDLLARAEFAYKRCREVYLPD